MVKFWLEIHGFRFEIHGFGRIFKQKLRWQHENQSFSYMKPFMKGWNKKKGLTYHEKIRNFS